MTYIHIGSSHWRQFQRSNEFFFCLCVCMLQDLDMQTSLVSSISDIDTTDWESSGYAELGKDIEYDMHGIKLGEHRGLGYNVRSAF